MSLFLLLKVAHILGATVLLGTGAGIAFFMLMAHRTHDPRVVAHTAGVVVIADTLFTATAVVLQPLTGKRPGCRLVIERPVVRSRPMDRGRRTWRFMF